VILTVSGDVETEEEEEEEEAEAKEVHRPLRNRQPQH
jgi:hypothetical protein